MITQLLVPTLVNQLTDTLKVRPEELPDRIGTLVARLKDAEREIARAKAQQTLAAAAGLVEQARDVDGVRFLGHDLGEGASGDDLRGLALDLRGRLRVSLRDQLPGPQTLGGVPAALLEAGQSPATPALLAFD